MSMTIVEDKGQQAGKHEAKHQWFDFHDVELLQAPLPVGDYILCTDVVQDVINRKAKRGVDLKKMDFLGSYRECVDTKKDMQEIVSNICGKQHERFRDECILAKNNGIQLYVLIENADGIRDVNDVAFWENPRTKIQKWITTSSGQRRKVLKYPDATKGITLFKAMCTMQNKYGVRFLFCRPEEAGERIVELLGGA